MPFAYVYSHDDLVAYFGIADAADYTTNNWSWRLINIEGFKIFVMKILGNFSSRSKLGAELLREELKHHGVDPQSIPDRCINEIVRSAMLLANDSQNRVVAEQRFVANIQGHAATAANYVHGVDTSSNDVAIILKRHGVKRR